MKILLRLAFKVARVSSEFGYVNHNVGNNEHFPGILDELSFYNIALDQSQIQLNMNNELSGLEQGLVGIGILILVMEMFLMIKVATGTMVRSMVRIG